jgi:hypothetical protein
MWNDPTVQKYLDVLAIYSKLEVRSKVNAASPSNANHAWRNAPTCATGWCKQAAPLEAPRPRAVNHAPLLEIESGFSTQMLTAFAPDDCVELVVYFSSFWLEYDREWVHQTGRFADVVEEFKRVVWKNGSEPFPLDEYRYSIRPVVQ